MSPDHFKKRTALLTCTVCVIGYAISIVACLVIQFCFTFTWWQAVTNAIVGWVTLSLCCLYGRTAIALSEELRQENLEDTRKPWDRCKADLLQLHELHGKQ